MKGRYTLLKDLLKKENIKRIAGVRGSKNENIKRIAGVRGFKNIFSLAFNCTISYDYSDSDYAIIESFNTNPKYLGFIFNPHYILMEGVIGSALQINPSLYYLKKELLSSFK